MKYVIAFIVALFPNQVHAAVGPVVKFVGATSRTCKYRATAPAIKGAAIEVPDWVANVFVTPVRNGYVDRMEDPGAKISTHCPKLEK